MVSILVGNDIAVEAEINGAHNGVSALFVDDVLNGGAIGINDFVETIENRICISLIGVGGEKCSCGSFQTQGVCERFTIRFRYVLLSFKGGGEPYLVYSDLVSQFLIADPLCLLCGFERVQFLCMLQADQIISVILRGHCIVPPIVIK